VVFEEKDKDLDIVMGVALAINLSLILYPIIFEQLYPSVREMLLPITILLLTFNYLLKIFKGKMISCADSLKKIRIGSAVFILIIALISLVDRFKPFLP